MQTPSPLARSETAMPGRRGVEVWLHEACFPFWAERAAHPSGGFRERLSANGDPIDDERSRVRVQARQTLVFARAALLGWRPAVARELVQRGVDSLLGPCRRDDGLVGRLVRPGVGLVDAQPELYDNAFAIMALAWASRALDAPELIAEADRIFTRLDASHAHPAGGFHETLPPRSPRRQNPHMHLFEASLALHAASGADRHLARARTMLGLFEDHFFDRATGCVREQLGERLEPLDAPAAHKVEPGHAFEWVALIGHYCGQSGEAPPSYVPHLYQAAVQALDAQGAVPLTASSSGDALDGSRRVWAQTEALRAHLARASAGDRAAAERASRQLEQIFASHLDPAPAGGWIDHLDPDSRPLTDTMTAASGYHVVTAFAEAADHPATRALPDAGAAA